MAKASIGFATLVLGLVAAFGYAQQAPVPFINQPLVPDAVAPGGPDFTLTVNGTGFVSKSTVNWNTTPLATTFVSGSQLTAAVPAADIATATTGWVTVVNPAPGGGTSNIAFFTVTDNRGSTVVFSSASSLRVGSWPDSVALGDFNGDGKLDLAVANRDDGDDGTVSILLGDGTGNFTLVSSLGTGSLYPSSVAVGDFNGDGKLDLAVAGGSTAIFLGDGTGNFTLATSSLVGGGSVATGDFNGDGKLDLAVTNYSSNSVSILLGDGTGNFTLASSPAAGVNPMSVAVGDFNRDGNLDLAVVNYSDDTLSILLGDGSGNFTLASSTATGSHPYFVAVGDVNGDGKLDLAVANACGNDPSCRSSSPGTVSVLLGDGTGNFTLASSPATGSHPYSLAAGDFNGDANLDLAVGNGDSNTVSVLLGDGTGNFSLASSPATGLEPNSVAVGDFNGDGTLDLAVANNESNNVSILLQLPSGPQVRVSPASLSFGAQLVFTPSAPQTVTLTNTGTAMLDITSIVASANFSETNTCGSSLAAGANCTITVTFMPHAPGPLSGAITITDNATDSPQTVTLAGIGTVVGLRPSTVSFGTQAVGTTSSPLTVTLLNRASRTVNIYGIGFRGSNPGDFAQTNTCGTSVAPGATCTINVTFTPQATGSRNATLNVVDNGGGSPQTVTLRGYGM